MLTLKNAGHAGASHSNLDVTEGNAYIDAHGVRQDEPTPGLHLFVYDESDNVNIVLNYKQIQALGELIAKFLETNATAELPTTEMIIWE